MNNNNLPFVIISVILIVSSIAVFYFLIIPQFEKIAAQEKEISDLEFKLENTTNYFNAVKENADKLKELGWDDVSKKIDANFMDGPFFVHNMEVYLKGLVTRSGLYLKDLRIEGVSQSFDVEKNGTEGNGALKEVNIFFDVSGDYGYFRDFLNLLNKQALVIKISSIDINSSASQVSEYEGESASSNSILNFQIKGSIPSK